MILGVGSGTDAAASLYMQLGANFIVTPFERRYYVACNRRKVLWSQAVVLTEIARAEE
jgi:2-dehydro-3-deoxyphosphogluconate aldolase/(4S)-4-hydroxy-2-oxoglutarate aldolase